MITREVTKTPYGFRLTYALNGESYWTEYITHSVQDSPFEKKVANGLVAWANGVWRRNRPLAATARAA